MKVTNLKMGLGLGQVAKTVVLSPADEGKFYFMLCSPFLLVLFVHENFQDLSSYFKNDS